MKHYPITVFTPTYNRAYCLERAYRSLCRQSYKDFDWLIIDDGSSDNTKEIIDSWISEGLIPIRYIYQDNQGMHGAHNTAFRNIESELCLCLDSDDMLTDDCLAEVMSYWDRNLEMHGKVAGIMGLDGYMDGSLLGSPFPDGMTMAADGWLREVAKMKGDKKLVYRTEVAKEVPEYPVFEDEKYGSMGFKILHINHKYPWLLLPKIIYLVEYQVDGSTRNMYKQYRRALKGWDLMRKLEMKHCMLFNTRFIKAIHYVSNSIFLCKWNFIQDSPKKMLTLLAIPFGILLNIYIRIKTLKNNKNV